jgi:kynurenine formamidase
MLNSPLFAQTQESGPWWPHAIWGPDDQACSSNWITPEKVVQALKLVKTGKIYELGQIYERGMPLYGDRTYSIFSPGAPTYGPLGKNDLVANDEFLCTEIGQVGTQFDGPGHIGKRIRMADGSEQDVFYNGITMDEMSSPYGLQKLGVENIKPFITRGLLIDIAAFKGVVSLDHAYEITVADVRGALQKQNIAENRIAPGDAIFFNTGWSNHWQNPEKFNLNPPGIGMAVAQWLIEKKPAMVGSDHYNTEVMPNPDPELFVPVHQELIMKHGILNMENMVYSSLINDNIYEFLFIFTPIRFKGATGSPGRPIAVY